MIDRRSILSIVGRHVVNTEGHKIKQNEQLTLEGSNAIQITFKKSIESFSQLPDIADPDLRSADL